MKLICIYIYNIHTQTYPYTHIFFTLLYFPMGGLVARRIMGYPVRAKRSFGNLHRNPLDLGLEAVFLILIFKSYFQNGELSG